MYLLDSDIFSFTLSDPEQYPLLSENLDATDPSERWISTITAQELIAWRYNPLLKVPSQQPPRVLKAYLNFLDMLAVLCVLQIKPFDEAALKEFRKMPGNVGSRDRRIAAIALAHNFTVVTNNERHFNAIQRERRELRVENWTKRVYFPRTSTNTKRTSKRII